MLYVHRVSACVSVCVVFFIVCVWRSRYQFTYHVWTYFFLFSLCVYVLRAAQDVSKNYLQYVSPLATLTDMLALDASKNRLREFGIKGFPFLQRLNLEGCGTGRCWGRGSRERVRACVCVCVDGGLPLHEPVQPATNTNAPSLSLMLRAFGLQATNCGTWPTWHSRC